jgi:hypothetical protein
VRDIAALIHATEDTTPDTTLGESLGETIPGIQDRLTLIVIGDHGPAALLWDPTFILPKEIALRTNRFNDASYSASFDSGGRFIALAAGLPGTTGWTISIGIPTDVGRVDLNAVDSHVWHATEIGRFAWIAWTDDGTKHLMTAKANPLGKSLGETTDLGAVPDAATLIRWDASGFILNDGGDTVVLLKPDGSPATSFEGVVVAASATTMVTAPAQSDPSRLTDASLRSRNGELVEDIFLRDPATSDAGIETGTRTFAMSRTSDLLATVDMDSATTRLKVEGPSLSATRNLRQQTGVIPIGFTSDDRYFVFVSERGNNLIFVDWNAGRTNELAIPDEYLVLAFDIG